LIHWGKAIAVEQNDTKNSHTKINLTFLAERSNQLKETFKYKL